ncbi:hypothetical protein GCM10009736_38950 [Actinomadura bangladeshensis]
MRRTEREIRTLAALSPRFPVRTAEGVRGARHRHPSPSGCRGGGARRHTSGPRPYRTGPAPAPSPGPGAARPRGTAAPRRPGRPPRPSAPPARSETSGRRTAPSPEAGRAVTPPPGHRAGREVGISPQQNRRYAGSAQAAGTPSDPRPGRRRS